MAITNATRLAGYVGAAITGNGPNGSISLLELISDDINVLTLSASNDVSVNGQLTGAGATFTGNLIGVAATFSGNVTVGGTLTYDDVTNIDSVGLITARNGLQVLAGITTISGQSNLANVNVSAAASFGGNVSIADSIFHTGDTNTSIRFPATDTFTVETGGSERVRVDSSGRLLVNKTASTSSNIGGIGYANVAQIEGSAVGAGLNVSNTAETARINIIWKETESSLSDGDKLGHLSFGAGVANAVERARIECNAETTDGTNKRGGQLTFMTCADGNHEPTERLRISNAGTALFKGGLAEKYENAGTTLGAQTANPLSDGNVILFSGNESGNLTINFTGVHATLSNGETVSFTAIITPNSSGKITAVQVDGQTPAGGLKWSGGSAPSAGASGQDIYTFQILKTASGATNYTVFGAATNYA